MATLENVVAVARDRIMADKRPADLPLIHALNRHLNDPVRQSEWERAVNTIGQAREALRASARQHDWACEIAQSRPAHGCTCPMDHFGAQARAALAAIEAP